MFHVTNQQKKRLITISLFISILLATVVMISQITMVRSTIAQPNQSVLYDDNHTPLVPHTFLVEGEVPVFLSSYLLELENRGSLSQLMYPQSPVKRFLSTFFIPNDQNEQQKLYANHMYFGHGLIGINNASQYFFQKKVDELTEAELVFLFVQLEQRSYEDIAYEMNEMASEFLRRGLLSEDVHAQVVRDIPATVETAYHEQTAVHSYVAHVIDEIQAHGYDEEDFFRRGYDIYTNMDREFQLALFRQFSDDEYFPDTDETMVEGSMVILNHSTGDVKALMGGREYLANTFNRATETTRQPASAFKPLIVFAPAIEVGWRPESTLIDQPLRIGDFSPRNHDHEFRGEVTLAKAFTSSYNVPATWLLNQIGFKTGIDYITRFNLFEIDVNDGYGLALGFTSVGTSPLAMAQAYTVFPNKGNMLDTQAISKVEGMFQRSIIQASKKERKIFEEETAEITTDLLVEAVENGSGESAKVEHEKWAGKTGTTSFDGWFVGFNEQYLGAVWIGPDEVIPENRMSLIHYSGELFKSVILDYQNVDENMKDVRKSR
ncbi:penicillin-binding transpeptidase domain-containing protein [Alkalihalobacillus sp. MEB130]|uniref:penicillin-binding transpeptidase domain-containing protein n=1 Tax=Alkalihalobacillus sp. MEB130 TaxID=2976704 RepID=UPI0028DE5B99|nr:penicillin-binding transpeptidase domain-containing protein [Alkalihalobacillus sp. MEB130]MDT8858831.1 penicillin-binding transpeptidase domain-containing protein [Alkalihalobacillus sp. MEB130]